MGNAGHSADIKTINQLIVKGDMLVICADEHPVMVIIKTKINELIASDEIKKFPNRKYGIYHTAWMNKYKLLIKINQIRQKHWYWNKIM